MRLRKIAAVSTLALTAASFSALAPSATAATAELPYACNVPLLGGSSNQTFNTTIDTDFPASVVSGKSANLTLKIAVPDALANMLHSGGSISGKVTGRMTVGGKAATYVATLPPTTKAASGPTVATAKATVKLTAVGANQALVAGNYDGDLTAKVSDGSGGFMTVPGVVANCVAPAAGNKTIDTVSVTAPPVAATKTTVKAKAAKGKVTLNVSVTGTKTGKVTLKVTGKKKATKVVTIKNGKGKVTIKKLKKGKYKVVGTLKAGATYKSSKSKKVAFKVK